jgi:hypothetical protein
VDIIVEPRSLRITKSGAVLGAIWLRSKDDPGLVFPEAGWSDFPVVILGWWLREIETLLRSAAVEATCSFMDGPFEFSLKSSGELQLRERRTSGAVAVGPETLRMSADEFWKALHVAASEVLAECDAREWSSGDIESLRRFIA